MKKSTMQLSLVTFCDRGAMCFVTGNIVYIISLVIIYIYTVYVDLFIVHVSIYVDIRCNGKGAGGQLQIVM